jgi:hypothetical protein
MKWWEMGGGKTVYTVVCPGSARYTEEQRKGMRRDDRRLHAGGGWYSDTFPTPCRHCGEPAQSRGSHVVFDLK